MSGSRECDWVEETLPEFLAGRVSEEDDQRVRSHLETCAECRKRANAVSLLQQTPVPEPDPGRWGGFVDDVVDAAGREESRRFPRWALAVVGALLLALVLLFAWVGLAESHTRGPDRMPLNRSAEVAVARADETGTLEAVGERPDRRTDQVPRDRR